MRTGRLVFTWVVATMAVIGVTSAHAGFEPIPSPGSLGLLATGIAALAGGAWWFRRK
jgi:hypothetical protein